ncbi:kinase-like domain-containing protein [Rhizophagus irregularis DAOM 181602=DAOM 197198]|uniref:Protein kinase domain-containing protein n=1 Tax=Rhizophagus irregularis (strain DAOM 181602 / DAOM 197198 / MUCL 43194) TaxID=747089 RepID=U9TBY1_RHIID|nr:kinase-like domain-containing protein [Rhizophagus irregularis DAOM 181602=DAOM 197198]
MYEVISGLPSYHNISHNKNLAIGICQGLRPRFNIKVPQLIIYLIKRCLDSDPLKRPKAEEIENILYTWNCKFRNNSKSSTCLGISYMTHSEAIYTRRFLNFNNLPEPNNSDDYYEQNDNINL